MLRCDQVGRELSDAIDGEAPPMRIWMIRMHVLMCQKCRRMDRSLRRTRRLLARMAEEPVQLDAD